MHQICHGLQFLQSLLYELCIIYWYFSRCTNLPQSLLNIYTSHHPVHLCYLYYSVHHHPAADFPCQCNISNNPSFGLKHRGVPDGSDGSGGISYPLTENQTRPVAQSTGRVAYLPCGGYYTKPLICVTRRVVYYARRSCVRLPLLCVRNVVTYTHNQNDMYVTLFAGVAVMQQPFTQRLAMFMPYFGR